MEGPWGAGNEGRQGAKGGSAVVALTAALAAVVLLVLSAGLAAARAAVLKIGDSGARVLSDEGFAGADALSAVRAGQVAASPLGILQALCALGAVAAGTAAVHAGWGGRPWATLGGGAAVALVVFLAGDVVARGLAGRRPVRLALAAAPLLRWGSGFFGRLLLPFRLLERRLSHGRRDGGASPNELQVREALDIGTDAGIVEADEHRLVERAFKLDELTAWDAMTPRVDIFAWRDSLRVEEIVGEMDAALHSRVPVYRDTIDDVTGILHLREAYRALVAGRGSATLSELARTPMFVPGSLSLAKLLSDFRARRTHMGIVADEFGGTDGLITLEDVLEELVGEIVDETDLEDDPLTRISDDEIVAAGTAELREINERFGFALPAGENRSLNGFIADEMGKVPAQGTAFEAEGARVEVLEASETQVIRARLKRLPAVEAEP